ncbi:hypothetical protein D3C78_1117630 [compost metagenome]
MKLHVPFWVLVIASIIPLRIVVLPEPFLPINACMFVLGVELSLTLKSSLIGYVSSSSPSRTNENLNAVSSGFPARALAYCPFIDVKLESRSKDIRNTSSSCTASIIS